MIKTKAPSVRRTDESVGKKPWRMINHIAVRIVDGERVRRDLDVDFTNSGSRYQHSKIPAGEIWISDEIDRSERKYLIDYELEIIKKMMSGYTLDGAKKAAEKREVSERARGDGIIRAPRGAVIRESELGEVAAEFSDGVIARFIDGRMVRDKYDDTFTEGGHDLVYNYVPKSTIIVERNIRPELQYILIHEKRERDLMRGGMSYDSAHARANSMEARAQKMKTLARATLLSLGLKEKE